MINEESKLYLKRFIPLLVIFIGIPFLSYLMWLFYPTTNFQILVLDKTVLNEKYQEHFSFFWILDHYKFRDKQGEKYDAGEDYFGFYPDGSATYGVAKGLENHTKDEIKDLVSETDLIFIADTYGVFKNDFKENNQEIFSPKIYGGLSREDLIMLEESKMQDKTIVVEFNTMASPTSSKIRAEFENLMGIKWTGWIGRYYEESDSLQNDHIPDWFFEAYKAQNEGKWVSEGSGIIFVHEDGRLFVIEAEKDYLNRIPQIKTQPINKHGFDLPELIPYPDWFDVVLIERDYEVISYYDINPTTQGMEKLKEMGLPRFFPAAVVKNSEQGQLYYLAGDFTDLRLQLGSSKFTGVPSLYRGLHLISNYNDRKGFFWNYYYPLMSQILKKSELRKREKSLLNR